MAPKEFSGSCKIGSKQNQDPWIPHGVCQHQTCENLLMFIEESKIIIKVHSQAEKDAIEELGVSTIYVENEISSQTIASLVVV